MSNRIFHTQTRHNMLVADHFLISTTERERRPEGQFRKSWTKSSHCSENLISLGKALDAEIPAIESQLVSHHFGVFKDVQV